MALYNRDFDDADGAFKSANASGSGKLMAEELTEKLRQRNAAITAESVADLMNRYMTPECDLGVNDWEEGV